MAQKHILGFLHGALLATFWCLVIFVPSCQYFVVPAVLLSIAAFVVFLIWIIEVWQA